MYSPLIGRFAERDPIEADENLYRYVGNAPTMATDPSGCADAKAGMLIPTWWYGNNWNARVNITGVERIQRNNVEKLRIQMEVSTKDGKWQKWPPLIINEKDLDKFVDAKAARQIRDAVGIPVEIDERPAKPEEINRPLPMFNRREQKVSSAFGELEFSTKCGKFTVRSRGVWGKTMQPLGPAREVPFSGLEIQATYKPNKPQKGQELAFLVAVKYSKDGGGLLEDLYPVQKGFRSPAGFLIVADYERLYRGKYWKEGVPVLPLIRPRANWKDMKGIADDNSWMPTLNFGLDTQEYSALPGPSTRAQFDMIRRNTEWKAVGSGHATYVFTVLCKKDGKYSAFDALAVDFHFAWTKTGLQLDNPTVWKPSGNPIRLKATTTRSGANLTFRGSTDDMQVIKDWATAVWDAYSVFLKAKKEG